MKKFSKILLLSALAVFLVAGSAWATPLNLNRPLTLGTSSDPEEPSLQGVFDETFGVGVLDAYNDQSNVALWTPAEAQVDSYLITLLSSAQGNLGIYSALTGATYTFTLGSDNAVDFMINNAGDLYVDSSLAITGFGSDFGFYWATSGLTSYTEDDMNAVGSGYGLGENILALSYLVVDGTEAYLPLYSGGTTVTLEGNNDWVLAFEDWAASSGGDGDFQDAVFLVEDMNPVPEPMTMLLLGFGLIGLGLARRKS